MPKRKKSFLRKIILFKKMVFSHISPYIYRVVRIEQSESEEYIATVQVIGKRVTFKMKPEEILSDDSLTDKFSQRDIRALTYLGYLGINSPKYQILAQRLAENEKMMFTIHKKGSKTVELKTAQELSRTPEILESLSQSDAHKVGYTDAKESVMSEGELKKKAQIHLINKEK